MLPTELSPRAAAEAERQREVKLSLTEGEQVFLELPQIQQSLAGREPGKELEYIQRSYSRAIYRYDRPYDGKMTLLVNEELYQSSPNLGWEDTVTGESKSMNFP